MRVNKKIDEAFLKGMAQGVPILDTVTKPCKIWKEDETGFHIIITQGLNRQIRRMCEAVGLRVIGLKRIRIGNVRLGDLPTGQWRYLRPEEKF